MPPAQRHLVLIVLLTACMGGCNLLETYQEVPTSGDGSADTSGAASGCTPGETASCSCRDGSSGLQTCQSNRTWGPCRCGDATGDADRTFDSEDGATKDVAEHLPPNICPADAETYRIRPAKSVPHVDARCTDAEFGHAREIPFPNDVDTTDNDISCRAVWLPDERRIHACCDIEDDTSTADATQGDAPSSMWEPNGTGDDRIEYWLKCNLDRDVDGCSHKTFINNLPNGGGDKGTPTYFASVFDPSANENDFSWNPYENARIERRSSGWSLEWTATIGFNPAAAQTEHTGLCQFAVMDVDGDSVTGSANSFGVHNSINRPANWGCCFYEPKP